MFNVFTGCPSEWVNYRDKCYFFSKDLHSFNDAKASCESMSSSLLIINDVEEQVTICSSVLILSKVILLWRERSDSLCPHVTSEMAEEADVWKGLLLDGSDRQGRGKCLALAGWDRTCFHVSSES